MKILSILYRDDANITLIKNGKIPFAIVEGRISREKFHTEFSILTVRRS